MKKLYWRPQRVSLKLLWVVALVGISGLIAVENYRVREQQPFYVEKMRAAKLAKRAFEVILQERLRLGHPLDAEADPAGTGLIGDLLTPVTTNPGHLPAKQTSANPNFAAVIVHLLMRAGVEPGDRVAVGVSGSFPALNICLYAAMKELELKPVIISSAGSSQWGANFQDFMWPIMEKVLEEKRVFPFRSVAVSRGGIDDRGLGLTKSARKLLDHAIEISGAPPLFVANYDEGLQKRMEIFQEQSEGDDYAVYINVGGGTTSVGTKVGKKLFKPGLNRYPPRGPIAIDSVMSRFASDGVPVIHLIQIDTLATYYGLPSSPTTMPKVGEGKIFYREVHSPLLALIVLLIITALLVAFVRLDWGYRLFAANKRDTGSNKPERMV